MSSSLDHETGSNSLVQLLFCVINSIFLGLTLEELSKDKPVDKNVDKHANGFVQNLEDIETELTKQIAYLSQVCISVVTSFGGITCI